MVLRSFDGSVLGRAEAQATELRMMGLVAVGCTCAGGRTFGRFPGRLLLPAWEGLDGLVGLMGGCYAAGECCEMVRNPLYCIEVQLRSTYGCMAAKGDSLFHLRQSFERR